MRRGLFLILLTFVWAVDVVGQQTNDAEIVLQGQARGDVNLRDGPGTGFAILSVLPDGMTFTLDGRNQSSTWLMTSHKNVRGWVSYTYVDVLGDVRELPVVDVDASSATNPNSQAAPRVDYPAQQIVSPITENVRQIYENGQLLGNRAEIFVKVGDSITASDYFLDQIGYGVYDLGDYEYLEGAIRFYSQTPISNNLNSFNRVSVAARSGWTAGDVLDYTNSPPGSCLSRELPLNCEYRLTRPSIALIMFGTNDIGYVPLDRYQANLVRIVEISIDMGVIPVLSTIPARFDAYSAARHSEFNQVIRDVANDYNVPLWDYEFAMRGLPNLGLSNDGIHPSVNHNSTATAVFSPDGLLYGYNMRNLTALQVLDAIWLEVILADLP